MHRLIFKKNLNEFKYEYQLFDFDFNRLLSVIIATFKNSKIRFLCLEITYKYLSLSVILLFTFAVFAEC